MAFINGLFVDADGSIVKQGITEGLKEGRKFRRKLDKVG